MKHLVTLVLLTLALAGCNQALPEAPADPNAPQQPAPQKSGDNGMLWGLGGFLLGQALSSNNTQHHVIERSTTIIREAPKPAPKVQPAPAPKPASRPSVTPRPSFSSPSRSFSAPRSFGGRR